MEGSIIKYQKSFNRLIERFRKAEGVLAVMVFGSMVTGDLWEESDIDLFVIIDEHGTEIKNIYTYEKDVPVHIKLMSKEKFKHLYEEDKRGGFMHRIFASSRLVYSKDLEITKTYDSGRYYPDIDRERWNMVYLGRLLKNIGVCKKYIANDGVYTAYSAAVRCLEDYAKLLINSSGYMISKDAMAMAMNLNDEYKKVVDELFYTNEINIKNSIEKITCFIDSSIDKIIRTSTKVLINFMKDSDCTLSAEDIIKDNLFENYNINMEEILNKLYDENLIKRQTREFVLTNKSVIFEENVYYV
ncbi:MAG: nucleotidyltransferase domain-containing protein [Clostridiaceae bacterium]